MNPAAHRALQRRIKRHVAGPTHTFFVVAPPGLETLCRRELAAILGDGRSLRPVHGGVVFEGRLEDLYRANLQLRTASRVLMRLAEFKAAGFGALAKRLAEIPWELYLPAGQLPAVHVTARHSRLYHSQAVAERVRAAVARRLEVSIDGPLPVDRSATPQQLFVRLQDDRLTLSLDSSGENLFKRGIKTHGGRAPLRETLAAAILLMAGYRGAEPLLDPMCGSGTLLIEAAMIACNIPANINRDWFGFQTWKDYDPSLFATIHEASLSRTRDFPFRITGYDKAPSAVRKATGNIEGARLSEFIQVEQRDFFKTSREDEGPLFLICNPPYGDRLPVDMPFFYGRIGDTLKQGYSNTQAWILTGNLEALKHVGLRPTKKIKLFNGGIESRLVLYNIYQGSRKAKYQ